MSVLLLKVQFMLAFKMSFNIILVLNIFWWNIGWIQLCDNAAAKLVRIRDSLHWKQFQRMVGRFSQIWQEVKRKENQLQKTAQSSKVLVLEVPWIGETKSTHESNNLQRTDHQSIGQDQRAREKRRKDRLKWKAEVRRNWDRLKMAWEGSVNCRAHECPVSARKAV